MTIVYPTIDIIGAGIAIADTGGTLAISDGDTLIIAEDINVVSTGTNGIQFEAKDLNIYLDGEVAANFQGIDLDFENIAADQGFNYRISIGQSGSIETVGQGIYAGSNDHSSVNLGDIAIDNAGQITCFNSTGVFMFFAVSASFSNSGSVISHDNDAHFANAVVFYRTDIAFFENTGLVKNWQGGTASSDDIATVAFVIGTENVSGTNSGQISGGRVALYSEATVSESFVNSGTLIGNVEMSNTVGGSFGNSGMIIGDVYLKGGADTFDGRGGTVDGTVFGGSGDDTYIIDDASIILSENADQGTDEVQSTVGYKLGNNFENLMLIGGDNIRGSGNSGGNLIVGNIGDNRLQGKAGADNMHGGDGDDRMLGGGGNDQMYGNDGNDILNGRLDNDTLSGNNGDDTLRGASGNDTLFGGSGDDRLLGGLGLDRLFGGLGEDEFVFNRKNDSLNSIDADLIEDFVVGEDLIDLSGLAGELTYIGSAGFSGAVGEVQVIPSGGTLTRVRIDLDGDGAADMKIMVVGTVGLSEAEFML